jgi:hypothetical protein
MIAPSPVTGCTWIPLTQGRFALVDDVDADLGAMKWYAYKGKTAKTFYARRNLPRVNGRQTVRALHEDIARRMGIVGAPDHADRNGLNNRRDNLRPASDGLNNANQGIRVDNVSGYKGVSWRDRTRKWHAQIQVCGKKRHLGFFSDLIEAAKAYDRAALEAFGEFAVVNFPVVVPTTATFAIG